MTESYNDKTIESLRVAFGTVLTAFAMLEMMGPLEECMEDYKLIVEKIMEELQGCQDREKIDLLISELRKINKENGY